MGETPVEGALSASLARLREAVDALLLAMAEAIGVRALLRRWFT